MTVDMTLPDYLYDVADAMAAKSKAIGRDFAKHRPSAGKHREDLVSAFLKEHLPQRFKVRSGFVFSSKGHRSKQADLIVVDAHNNAPLYGGSSNELWPVESVYALIEVKTRLTPKEISDSLEKCRVFKLLERRFASPVRPFDSLFIIWAFDGPSTFKLKKNMQIALAEIPQGFRPDLCVVNGRSVVRSGSYFQTSETGEIGSPYHTSLLQQHGLEGIKEKLGGGIDIVDSGSNSLLVWFLWFDSWLRSAGPRAPEPLAYLPKWATWGTRV